LNKTYPIFLLTWFLRFMHSVPPEENPYLHPKMVFLASETLLSLSGRVEKNFLFDFERYDLTNGKE
jgi:hypothetical protein